MKASLRKQLRHARSAFSPAEHEARSNLAASAITRMPAFRHRSRVAVYLPFDHETNTAALLIAARRRGVHLYVPVVVDVRHRRMRFHRLIGKTRRGVFGISVPHSSSRCAMPVDPRWFNLIVVPLVGIDGHGRRMGMGGGFYDRALAFRRGRRQWKGPRLVGLGFDSQRVESVFADKWDVRLDAVTTESGVKNFNEGAA